MGGLTRTVAAGNEGSWRAAVALALLAAALHASPLCAAEPPRRVASLNLSADEVLVEILPAERLVAVTRWADEPGSSNVVGCVPPRGIPRARSLP